MILDKNIYILDFEDSFTFNIANELYPIDQRIEVIPFNKVSLFLDQILTRPSHLGRFVLIYGPGPGHPKEYEELFPKIKKLIDNENIFHFGICLGHQILSILHGYNVERITQPCHGVPRSFLLPVWDCFDEKLFGSEIVVQTYNSLAVVSKDSLINPDCEQWNNGELYVLKKRQLLSYQFHPESVGTSCREGLFAPLFNFLYNGKDENSN